MKQKTRTILINISLIVGALIITIFVIKVVRDKVEKREKQKKISYIEPYLQINDSLVLEIEDLNEKIKNIQAESRELLDSFKTTLSKNENEFERKMDNQKKVLLNEIFILKKENYLLQSRNDDLLKYTASLVDLVGVYNQLNRGKNDKNQLNKHESIIKLKPKPYFKNQIEVCGSNNFDILKAVLKNEKGKVVKEYKNPVIINTSDIESGIYYLSFFDKNEKLIEKAQVVAKW